MRAFRKFQMSFPQELSARAFRKSFPQELSARAFRLFQSEPIIRMIFVVFGVIALALYITSFVMSGKYLDQKADWNEIKTELRKIWIITVVGSITLLISISLLYKEVQARDRYMYLLLLIVCMSLGFAFCSLFISMMKTLQYAQ